VAQVALQWDLRSAMLKIVLGLDNPSFEGEVDAFSRRYIGNARSPRPCHHTQNVKVQSQRVRVMLSRDSLHNNCGTGSSGLNHACEGLLLGMWAEGHRDSCDEAPPHT
jgi:hypothetical protein